MGEGVVAARGLGKAYEIGHGRAERATTLRDALARGAATLGRTTRRLLAGRPLVAGDAVEEFWALRDVDFTIGEGEVVGIIGRNGAGKSTLLKILSRITEPTAGEAEIAGRVASLLEVGTGFHHELTGRENIYLNGAVLGMTRAEIRAAFDAIVDFSGVEPFLDTPVKRYSSGMAVRLAFAVAAHLEPEILIVDEVLAVGDAAFQKKCLGKMRDVSGEGRTVLFVSHNMGTIRNLCRRGLVLERGRLVLDAAIDVACAHYLAAARGGSGEAAGGEWTFPGEGAPGDARVKLRAVRVRGATGEGPTFFSSEPIRIAIRTELRAPIAGFRLHLRLVTASGEVAFTSSDLPGRGADLEGPGVYESECVVPGNLLNRIPYFLQITGRVPGQAVHIPPTDIGEIFIEPADDQATSGIQPVWPGAVCPALDWTVRALAPAARGSEEGAAAGCAADGRAGPRAGDRAPDIGRSGAAADPPYAAANARTAAAGEGLSAERPAARRRLPAG